MQRLLYTLFQIDQAREYILDGRLERLRLALLILDNAIEVQVYAPVQARMADAEHDWRLRTRWPREGEPPEAPPLSRSAKRKIQRDFAERLTYAAQEDLLDRKLVGPLVHLHKYRNEAYHDVRVRPKTIASAASLLLELNCLLLPSLSRPQMWASDEDYSWIAERFGKDVALNDFGFDSLDLYAIAEQLRAGVVPDTAAVANHLADHIESRLLDIDGAIDFMIDAAFTPPTQESVLDDAYRLWEAEVGRADAVPTVTEKAHEKVVRTLASIKERVESVREATDRVAAFQEFGEIENDLDPIEERVFYMASRVDEAIQSQIDRMRGK